MENLITIQDNNVTFENKNVLIKITNRGRKVNLFVCDWDIPINELKEHLKNLKRSLGCNGSIKKELVEGIEKTVLHLQGEHSIKVKEYIDRVTSNSLNVVIKN